MEQEFDTVDQFFFALNKQRLSNTQQWIYFSGNVSGKPVQLKTFGHSYLQKFSIDGLNQVLPPMDCKVSTWKAAILLAFSAK
jgi:hypothetical protein